MANGTMGYTSSSNVALTDRFDIIKEVGDGSFGSVALAKVRSSSQVGRKGSVVAIKTMKKFFDSFDTCLELREVIFLRQLPMHPHLVPALDIFLDPFTKKLHIAMEYMDGNLFQMMKAREGKLLEGHVVKSVLYQILAGLQHIHANGFFHRDIKPENILVSSSGGSNESSFTRRYSAMVTPPSTPTQYCVKIADFGLAREMASKQPYTTYVSTRWYRAPEVLLRAGEYSAPVDIWAVGAMAVEVATLKPLFPGGNEVDQVWRVCEVMGSPGQWVGRNGRKIGGGEWREGTRLATRLGFSFPRMAPVPMETILPSPQWPSSLAQFVTSCLLWDPKARPTSMQALQNEYFRDAVDPLMPRAAVAPSSSRMSKKSGDLVSKQSLDSMQDVRHHPTLEKKGSWFRKSFIGGRSEGIISPPPTTNTDKRAEKRSTWHAPKLHTGSSNPANGAPMMILPSIKPVSPLSDAVSVQASRVERGEKDGEKERQRMDEKAVKKIGRQLSQASTNSQNNSYSAIDKLNGNVPGYVTSPTKEREGIFSHLKKRVRRLSGRPTGLPPSPNDDDLESGVGCIGWGPGREMGSNRSSMLLETPGDSSGIDKAIREVDAALDESSLGAEARGANGNNARRNLSFPPTPNASRAGEAPINGGVAQTPVFPRTRRSCRNTTQRYETPDENDELMNDVVAAASGELSRRTSQTYATPMRKVSNRDLPSVGYPTPSPQASHKYYSSKGMDVGGVPRRDGNSGEHQPKYPTPPSEDDSWGLNIPSYNSTSAAASARR